MNINTPLLSDDSPDLDSATCVAIPPDESQPFINAADETQTCRSSRSRINSMRSSSGLDCRICFCRDPVEDLCSPCQCSGYMRYVHRTCVQRWCEEKGDTICEICKTEFSPEFVYLLLPDSHDDRDSFSSLLQRMRSPNRTRSQAASDSIAYCLYIVCRGCRTVFIVVGIFTIMTFLVSIISLAFSDAPTEEEN
eukprot:Rmarinus@m.8844